MVKVIWPPGCSEGILGSCAPQGRAGAGALSCRTLRPPFPVPSLSLTGQAILRAERGVSL